MIMVSYLGRADEEPYICDLRFEDNGNVMGTGTDLLGDFILDGFWSAAFPRMAPLLLMHKMRAPPDPPDISMTLLGFMRPSARGVHGSWLFRDVVAGGFCAWRM